MRVKIIIQMTEMQEHDLNQIQTRHAEIFNGELDIAPKGEYLTKISLIAEGYEHPICDVPFSPIVGYWKWIPPMMDDSEAMEIMEQQMMRGNSVDETEQQKEAGTEETEGTMPG